MSKCPANGFFLALIGMILATNHSTSSTDLLELIRLADYRESGWDCSKGWAEIDRVGRGPIERSLRAYVSSVDSAARRRMLKAGDDTVGAAERLLALLKLGLSGPEILPTGQQGCDMVSKFAQAAVASKADGDEHCMSGYVDVLSDIYYGSERSVSFLDAIAKLALEEQKMLLKAMSFGKPDMLSLAREWIQAGEGPYCDAGYRILSKWADSQDVSFLCEVASKAARPIEFGRSINGLVSAGDKSALKCLVELIEKRPEYATQVCDNLRLLTRAEVGVLGDTPQNRSKAWLEWWSENEDFDPMEAAIDRLLGEIREKLSVNASMPLVELRMKLEEGRLPQSRAEAVKQALMEAASTNNVVNRGAAVAAMGALGDTSLIGLLKEISESDEFVSARQEDGAFVQYYPVREEASASLKLLREKHPSDDPAEVPAPAPVGDSIRQ